MNNVGDLGRRVSERRRELGLSPEAVATRAGMDPGYLRNLETSPSPELSETALSRLAAALETTVDALAGAGTQVPPGRTEPSGSPSLDTLDGNSCRDLIDPGGVGRVVFSEKRGPVAMPVNYQMLDGDVVFRTAALSSVTSDMALGHLSFEVDHLDDALAEGWSVLISGQGHVIVDSAELESAESLSVAPWAGGERNVYVRIVPQEVTGRRIRTR
jgi:transcriptional regulator with XRE-family HTH domain